MSNITRRSFVVAAATFPAVAAAQGEPITIVVPFPAGGSVDAIARLVLPGMQERLGATLIVDNKGGAAGSIGANSVARAAPDGKTWLFVFDSHATNPFLQRLTFDTEKDLAPVMLIGTAPNVLATHPSRPWRSLSDVVAAAKANPGKLTYATIGAGSLGHLTMVRLGRQLGCDWTHVPYRGGGPALNDAVGGHVDLIIGSAALVGPQLAAGALSPIVQFGASRARSAALSTVMTAAESGAAGIESFAWWGVFAPARTSAADIARFENALRSTLNDARVRMALEESQQVEVRAEGPEGFQRFFANEIRVWGAIIKDNNIQIGSQ
jgi:tripartite-type tricarboxylate transporter receptor subunit TctC